MFESSVPEGSGMLDRDTRQRVLEAAGAIFAARGFEAASVRDICDRAGANVSAVNYHFRSKEQLYVEAVRHAYESIAERVPLPAFPPGMPARQRLRLGEEEQRRLTADAWADHVTEFSLAALGRLRPHGKGDGS